jgi:hypothetical protein
MKERWKIMAQCSNFAPRSEPVRTGSGDCQFQRLQLQYVSKMIDPCRYESNFFSNARVLIQKLSSVLLVLLSQSFSVSLLVTVS